jgi:hypothetical protein
LLDVGGLAGRQHQLDRQPQAIHRRVDLGAEAAPAAAQGLGVRAAVFFYGGKVGWSVKPAPG